MAYGSLKPKGYIPRVADRQIKTFLDTFGAVEVSGTKWCGKTWSSLAHGESVSYIDDDYDVASADPKLVTLGARPHVIDEWQLVPAIWDAVRREVDKERGLHGAWILTGSSSPISPKSDSAPKHSGAGRFGRVRMYPMSLFESGDSAGAVSLENLFNGVFAPGMLDASALEATELVKLACRGGWPEAIDMDADRAQGIAREYVRTLLYDTLPRQGGDGDTVSRLLSSVARTLGQAATQGTLFSDMYGETHAPLDSSQRKLVSSYLHLLRSAYVLEEIPGWVPAARSPKRLSVKPKRYLADPSLAVAQLGMGVNSLLHDWQTFGMVFENLCMRDLMVYAAALPNAGYQPLRYYRDSSGLEVDAIIELADGRWAAIEIKASENKVDEGLDSLRRLRRKLCDNSGARTREPEFMAVLVGLSRYAREIEKGLYVIPIRALCP